MTIKKTIRKNISYTIAITEKTIKLRLRFKFNLIISFIYPLISILMPLIIMGQFLNLNSDFGPWTRENFVVYQFLAYNIILLQSVIYEFSHQINIEKYWKTLPALIISPFNRFTLMFGALISHIILISGVFSVFLILSMIIFPISFITFISVLIIFFLITIFFSGIGLIVSVFVISKENYVGVINFIISLFFMISCLTYPFKIFPESIQIIINLNPLYYFFDFLRLTWVENNIINTIILHPFHFFILVFSTTTLPVIGVFLFNYVYKKNGIVGY